MVKKILTIFSIIICFSLESVNASQDPLLEKDESTYVSRFYNTCYNTGHNLSEMTTSILKWPIENPRKTAALLLIGGSIVVGASKIVDILCPENLIINCHPEMNTDYLLGLRDMPRLSGVADHYGEESYSTWMYLLNGTRVLMHNGASKFFNSTEIIKELGICEHTYTLIGSLVRRISTADEQTCLYHILNRGGDGFSYFANVWMPKSIYWG